MTDDFCKIPIGDIFICCPAYPAECTEVWFEDADGYELPGGHYWDWREWDEEPMTVMGAILGVLKEHARK